MQNFIQQKKRNSKSINKSQLSFNKYKKSKKFFSKSKFFKKKFWKFRYNFNRYKFYANFLTWRNCGFFILNSSKNNLMFTLCNSRFKPIRIGSIGLLGEEIPRKNKRTDYVVGLLVNFVLKYARLSGIRYIFIILKMSVNYLFYTVLRVIAKLDLKIITIINLYNLPHNGVRHSKRRRL